MPQRSGPRTGNANRLFSGRIRHESPRPGYLTITVPKGYPAVIKRYGIKRRLSTLLWFVMPETSILRLIHLTSLCIQYVLPWGLAILLILVVRDTALVVTDTDSVASAWLDIARNIRVSRGFAFVFGAGCVVYGLQQRNLRRADRRRLLDRIATLERRPQAPKEAAP